MKSCPEKLRIITRTKIGEGPPGRGRWNRGVAASAATPDRRRRRRRPRHGACVNGTGRCVAGAAPFSAAPMTTLWRRPSVGYRNKADGALVTPRLGQVLMPADGRHVETVHDKLTAVNVGGVGTHPHVLILMMTYLGALITYIVTSSHMHVRIEI